MHSNETPNPTNLVVASEIRALMGRHRTTQAKLADAIGISQGTMSRRLNGEQPFTVDELDAIARHFDVPVTELFGVRTGSFPLLGVPTPPQLELPFSVERELLAV